MSNSITKLYVVGVLLFGFIAVALLGRTSFSQSSGNHSSGTGRYQVVSHVTGTSSNVILVDTQTGRMWVKGLRYSPATKKYESKWQEDGPFSTGSTSR